MSVGQKLAGAVIVVALVLYGVLAFVGHADTDAVVGFFLTALGGLAAALGEAAGSRFGTRQDDSAAASLTRCVGFVVLTLGALLLGVPATRASIRHARTLRDSYAFISVVIFVVAVSGGAIALLTRPRTPAVEPANCGDTDSSKETGRQA
jgi:drug/metabolite transporter (DMT)-like permease